MRPHVVLVLPPDPNDASGMVKGVTVVEVEKLVTELPAEGFDITFSPALPGGISNGSVSPACPQQLC
jgi:hypothetical protein